MDLMTTIVKLLESVLLNSYTVDKDEPEISNYTCDTSMTIDQFINLPTGEYLACLEFVYARLSIEKSDQQSTSMTGFSKDNVDRVW